jgi:hypothetical protein
MSLTFLNTLFLAGLAAAAIPIVIHLLQRRRLKRIAFSDLRFLAPLNQQRMRSLNMRRWLLLLLRVLIMALTALAMARPSLRGGLTNLIPTQARSSVMILLDTSYSMRAEGKGGTALDVAREAARNILSELQQGDEVNLMTFDANANRWFQTPVHDFAVIEDRLNEIEASWMPTHWKEGIEEALQVLGETIEPNRELYVISDFVGIDPDSAHADLSELQGETRVTLVRARVEPFVNVSIEDVQSPPGAILRDEPLRIGVQVRNHARDVPADCVLRIELEGEPKGEASLRLGKEAQQTQEFTVIATHARELAGVVSKRVDRMPADDVRNFVLPVVGQLAVLHIQGTPDKDGAFFLSRALSPSKEGRSPIRLTEVVATRFTSDDLRGRQVVVLSSDVRLSASQIDILRTYTASGGGVLLFSGQRQTADMTNRLLTALGDVRVAGVVERQEGYVNLDGLRPAGILAGFKEEEVRTLENIKFTRYAQLTPGSGSQVMLHYTGREPALVEAAHGNGRYMVFAFDAGTDGSNLSLSTMFLPLVHRSIVYLAGETGRQKLESLVGERIEVQIPLEGAEQRAQRLDGQDDSRLAQAGVSDAGALPDDLQRVTVTTPNGDQRAVAARYVGNAALVAFEDTQVPGHYVFEGLGHRFVRAVNVDTHESPQAAFEPSRLAEALQLDADELSSSASIGQHIHAARHGKELYKLIVVLVILLMILELSLSRANSRQASSGS